MTIIKKIGLETHITLLTTKKLFCLCLNYSNLRKKILSIQKNTCEICLGLPGVLPIYNKKEVEKKAFLISKILSAKKINSSYFFERKSYHYPDLPKGYQITQDKTPFSKLLFLSVPSLESNFKKLKRIRISRISIEEDAAKTVLNGIKETLFFSRAGRPLLEIVSEPDFTSAKEVFYYLIFLRSLVVNFSSLNMKDGAFKSDVNISLVDIEKNFFGPRIEVKNVNSILEITNLINIEFERQKKLYYQNPLLLKSETRGWNSNLKRTYFMRKKETILQYKFLYEEDLPLFYLSKYSFLKKKYTTSIQLERNTKQLLKFNLKEKLLIFILTQNIFSFFSFFLKRGIKSNFIFLIIENIRIFLKNKKKKKKIKLLLKLLLLNWRFFLKIEIFVLKHSFYQQQFLLFLNQYFINFNINFFKTTFLKLLKTVVLLKNSNLRMRIKEFFILIEIQQLLKKINGLSLEKQSNIFLGQLKKFCFKQKNIFNFKEAKLILYEFLV